MTAQILRAGADDAHRFERVGEEVFDEPIDPARLAAYLADRNHLMVIAVADGEVVGQCAAVIHRHPDQATELYIDNLGVAEPYRRQGIARELVARMFEAGRERGCREAWVGTEPDNEAANGLYRSLRGEPAEPFNLYLYKL